MIKVLCLPTLYSAKNYTGISQASMYMDLARTVNHVTDEIEWTFTVPESKDYIYWDDDMFADIERSKVLPLIQSGGEREKKAKDGFTGKGNPFFSPRLYEFFITDQYREFDVVLSSYYNANIIPSFQAEFEKGHWHLAPRPAMPAVVNMLSMIIDFPGMEHLLTDAGKRALASSILGADITVSFDPESRSKTVELAKQFLSPSELKRVLPLLYCLRTPVCTERIPVDKRPKDRATFFHAGTIVPWRNLEVIADAVGKASASRSNVKLLLATQHEHAPDWANKSYIDMRTGVTRAELYDLFKLGDFAPVAMETTTTAITYFEQAIAGMTPIWWARKWNSDLYPTGYPFVAKSFTELASMIVYCATYPEKAKVQGQEGIDWIKQMLAAETNGEKWARMIRKAASIKYDGTEKRCSGHFIYKIIEEVVSGLPTGFSKQDVLEGIFKKSKNIRSDKDLHSYINYLRALTTAIAKKQEKNVIW